MMRRAHYIAVVLLQLVASFSYCQWKQLASFNSQIVSIHFQSEQGRKDVGFVGTANGKVWRSLDDGNTWSLTATPAFLTGRITSFAFKDSLTGWFSALEQSTVPCVYRTTDGGANWLADTLYGNGTSITYNVYGPNKYLILTTWSGYNMVSTNDGARWTSLGISQPMCGVTFCTPQFGVMTGTLSQHIATSNNGGRTWRIAQPFEEVWHPFGIKNTSIVLGVAEISKQVLLSGNSGGDWIPIVQFSNVDLTGYIGGTLKALFLQAKDGVYVSRDTGQTWDPFCGPGNDYDTRMFVTGDTIYAGSVDGKLYVNYYGVSHYNEFLEFSQSQYDFISPGCFRLDSVIHLTSIGTCEKVKLQSVNFTTKSSPTFGLFAQQLPKIISSVDSIKVFYTPDDLKLDTADLIVTYYVGDDTTLYTKKIKLRGNGRQGLNVGFGKELEMLLASNCAKLDTFITLRNGPCDSLILISAVVSDTATFTVTTPTLPYATGPGGTIKLQLDVNTVTPGTYIATVLVRLSNGDTTLDTTIVLKLKVLTSKDPLVALSKSLLKFDSVSTCDIKFDTIRFKNTICKTVIVESATITPADPALSIVSAPSYPRSLQPNESDSVVIAYAPSDESPLVTSLRIRTSFDPATKKDSVIPISGFGKSINNALLTIPSLTFSSMKECEENEVISQLVNLSCDSATIIGIAPPTDMGFLVMEPTILTKLGPGDTIPIRIHVGPISSGSKFDSVGIRIRTRSGAERLLKLTLLGTVNASQRSFSLLDKLVLDSLAPCSTIDTILTLANSGICDTLVIDSVLLSGAPWFSIDPTQLPIRVLPGDSTQVHLHFSPPANGSSGGSVRFIGSGLDTAVILQVGTGSYVDPMPLSLSDSLFTAFLCKNARQSLVLNNPLCDTLVIDNISLTGSNGQFRFASGFTLPLRILPNEDTIIEIEFDPSGPGDSTALLTIGSGDYSITKRIPLLGSYRNTKGVAGIEAVIDDGTKHILLGEGRVFTVDIRSNNFIEKARDLTSMECTLRFNDNILTFQDPNYAWGNLDGFLKDSGFLFFRMKRNAPADITAGEVLASITFSTTIGDSTFSPIDFSVRLNATDSLYEQCVLEPLALAPIRVDIDDTCGDAIIRKWINKRLDIFDNFAIMPNPSAGAEEVLVTFGLAYERDVTLSLYDATGKKIKDVLYPGLAKGKHEIRLATPSQSEGWCFVMIEAPEQRAVKKLILRK